MDRPGADLQALMERFKRLHPRRQGMVDGYVIKAFEALQTAIEVAERFDADAKRQSERRSRPSGKARAALKLVEPLA